MLFRSEKDQNYIILGKYQSGKNNQLVDGYEGVYQDITVAPGGEFVFKTIATLAGSGTTYQTSETSQFGVTIVALDKDGKETETVLFTKTDGYKFDFLDGKYSVMVNVPTTVNKYPHDYPGHFTEQQYLPDELKDARFWHAQHSPSEERLYNWMVTCWGERFKN